MHTFTCQTHVFISLCDYSSSPIIVLHWWTREKHFGLFLHFAMRNAFHAINNCVFPIKHIHVSSPLSSAASASPLPSLARWKCWRQICTRRAFILITKWIFIQLSFEQTMIILIALLNSIWRKWALARAPRKCQSSGGDNGVEMVYLNEQTTHLITAQIDGVELQMKMELSVFFSSLSPFKMESWVRACVWKTFRNKSQCFIEFCPAIFPSLLSRKRLDLTVDGFESSSLPSPLRYPF